MPPKVLVFAAVLALAACSERAPLTAFQEEKPTTFGTQQVFNVGRVATYEDGLRVELRAIPDSRCKPGVQCVWQGELGADLRLSGGDLGNAARDLHLGMEQTRSTMVENYQFVLSNATTSTATLIVTKPGVQSQDSVDDMRVTQPRAGALVKSPLKVTGEARGPWFFEASFPVRLVDGNGKLLVEHYATAQGEWMTEEFVPFEATLEFAQPETTTGTLLIEKSNPSGLPEHAASRRIPIRFALSE